MKKILICFLCLVSLSFADVISVDSKNIDLPKKIEKIVAIGPGALRFVTYMQLEDKLVGIEKIESKPMRISSLEYILALGEQRVKSLPIIGAGGPGKLPNLEKIISLKPDVIVASFYTKEQLDLIANKTQIPVVSVDYGYKQHISYAEKRLDRVMESLELLGKVFNKEKRADSLISFMKEQNSLLKTYKVKNRKIYVGGLAFCGMHGITSSEKYYLPFQLLNIENPLAKKAKINHMFIQEESLISYNPDVIFLDLHGKIAIDEEIGEKKTLYKMLKAYKNEKIFWLLPYNFYNTNIENVYINSWLILKRLGFEVNIKNKMSEIYKLFYNAKYQNVMNVKYPLKEFECIK